MATSTSFRLSQAAKERLNRRAADEGTSSTALLERLINESIDQLDYPGIIFRGPRHDRRAALAAGPDVWEVVARLQDLGGSEEERVAVLSDESDLHPRQIRAALDYAAENSDVIRDRIRRNQEAADRSRRAAEERTALLS